MEELGPFRVNPDGKTLSRNRHAWNNGAYVANDRSMFLQVHVLAVADDRSTMHS
jgi:hypothetical protein